MPTSVGGIFYEELSNSPTFSVTQRGATAKQRIKIRWADMDAFVQEVFPSPIIGGCGITYDPAARFPGRPLLIADQLDIDPFVPDKHLTHEAVPADYDHAIVEISYKTKDYDDSGGEVLSHKTSIGAEFLTLPSGHLRWESQPVGERIPDQIEAGKLIPTVEHQLTYHYVPEPNFDVITAFTGCVNGSVGLFNAAPETLLFLGAEAERSITVFGVEAWKLDFRFTQRVVKHGPYSVGWNHFFRTSTGAWERILTQVGDPIYNLVEFSYLFTPPSCGP